MTPVAAATALAMLALVSSPMHPTDRCGFADHAAELSTTRQRVLERQPFALPGSPVNGRGHDADSCALLAFSIDPRGRARRIEVRKAWPGAIAGRAAVNALEGYRFTVPADPRKRYLIGIAFEPAERPQEFMPPGRTPP